MTTNSAPLHCANPRCTNPATAEDAAHTVSGLPYCAECRAVANAIGRGMALLLERERLAFESAAEADAA